MVALLAAGCASSGSGQGAATTTPSTGSGTVGVIVEPDQGIGPIDALLRSPQHSLDMVMYELVDTTVEQILAADAARGVTVRVVLDDRLERRANTPAYQYLNANGVHAVWAPTAYAATHEKAVVIDAGTPAARAVVMTLNLTSRYYSDTRDFAVVDTAPADVNAIDAAFVANFEGQAPDSAPPGADLVWSPGSSAALVELIGSATSTLSVENEEMSASPVIAALEGAARRGVQVHVTMTRDSEWASHFDALNAAGVAVRTYADSDSVLYIHAKAIVVDGHQAFVGSENFSDASLDENRELGLITSAPAVVSAVASTEATDWAGATPWTG